MAKDYKDDDDDDDDYEEKEEKHSQGGCIIIVRNRSFVGGIWGVGCVYWLLWKMLYCGYVYVIYTSVGAPLTVMDFYFLGMKQFWEILFVKKL